MTSKTSFSPILAVPRTALLYAAIFLLMAPSSSRAGACGDDVAGVRVPCGCGDVVVSSTRLEADDPVVSQRCEGDGLVVSAPSGAASIRLDLGGLSLSGSGSGVGIRVVRGGEGGASLVGDGQAGGPEVGARGATVSGFHTGLRAHGRRSVHEVRGITFSANAGDGVRLHAVETIVSGVAAKANGAGGVQIRGHGARIDDVTATDNRRQGLRVTGRDVAVGRVEVDGGSPVRGTGPSEALR
jgi:hypothetical protein